MHGPASHLHGARRRRGQKPVGVCRIDAHKYAALTTRRYRHVPLDEKREPAEHPLLGDVSFGDQEFPDAIGEIVVIRH
jgi:hypothetical protein